MNMFTPIQCACCERLNVSSVCWICRNWISALLKHDFDPIQISRYVKKRRLEQLENQI